MNTSTGYTIKANFAMPASRAPYRSKRPAKYPFATLAEGAACVFGPLSDAKIKDIRGYVAFLGTAKKMRFMTRTLPNGGFAVMRQPDARKPRRNA